MVHQESREAFFSIPGGNRVGVHVTAERGAEANPVRRSAC